MSSKMSSSDGGSVKINKVHQIVRLRQMLQKWRKTASLASISPKLMRRLSSSTLAESKQYYNQTSGLISSEDEDEHETLTQSTREDIATSKHKDETLTKPQLPPEGHLAVYVGKERRRFYIRTEHINHPLFRGLLEKTEQEFGINQVGGLAIACEVVFFEHLLWMVDNKHLDHIDPNGPELRELLDFYHMSNFSTNSVVQEPNCNAQQLHACSSVAANSDNYNSSRPCWL